MSWFSRLYSGFFKASFLALAAFGLVSAIPLPAAWSKSRDEICVPLRVPVKPLGLLTKVMMAEIVLMMILRRKRLTLSHETGHALGYYHMDATLFAHASATKRAADNTQCPPLGPVIQMAGPIAAFVDLRGSGAAGFLTPRLNRYVDHLIEESEPALADGTLYASAGAMMRAELQQMLRLDNIATVAGPMLEGYLMGRTVPFSDLYDVLRLRQSCRLLALAEKPRKEWQPQEYRDFIRREKQAAFREAEALLTSLDRDHVQRLVDALVAEAQQGKSSWCSEEMVPRIAALFRD